MVGHLSSFFGGNIPTSLATLQNCLHLFCNLVRLERFAIVLKNALVHAEAGFSPEVTRELSGEVRFDADCLLAVIENLLDFGRVKGNQILNLQLIRADSLRVKLYYRFMNHSLSRAP